MRVWDVLHGCRIGDPLGPCAEESAKSEGGSGGADGRRRPGAGNAVRQARARLRDATLSRENQRKRCAVVAVQLCALFGLQEPGENARGADARATGKARRRGSDCAPPLANFGLASARPPITPSASSENKRHAPRNHFLPHFACIEFHYQTFPPFTISA